MPISDDLAEPHRRVTLVSQLEWIYDESRPFGLVLGHLKSDISELRYVPAVESATALFVSID